MGHTYTNLLTHIIFSAKDRLPYLRDDRRVGVKDHVHALVRLPAALPVAKAVEIVKTNSSRWIHEYRVLHRTFAWQTGYAAFSVSESNADNVSAYINKQREHHQRITFQEELIALLKRSRVEYDERYLWK
jgi:putative transposase